MHLEDLQLTFVTVSQQPSQIMQVKRLPQLGASSATVGPSSKPKPRAQPAGLSARFKPLGVYDPAVRLAPVSQPDTVMEDAPDATPSTQKKKKEKGTKKRKLTPSEEDAEAAAYQLLGESQEAEINTKKQRTERRGSLDLGSAPPIKATPSQPVSTPAKKSKSSSAKKEKKVKTPAPSSTQPSAAKQTPVPLPSRQSHVPLPQIPGSSQPKRSPVPVPQPPTSSAAQSVPTPSKPEKTKKAKKSKDKKEKPSLQHSSSSKSETPVPPPVVTGMD